MLSWTTCVLTTVFFSSFEGGAAHVDGRLSINDIILRVNDCVVEGVPHADAVEALKRYDLKRCSYEVVFPCCCIRIPDLHPTFQSGIDGEFDHQKEKASDGNSDGLGAKQRQQRLGI